MHTAGVEVPDVTGRPDVAFAMTWAVLPGWSLGTALKKIDGLRWIELEAT
jgi:hypothetical protein